MLQYIIDAYGQKNKEERFYKTKKNMNIIYKVALYIILLELVNFIICIYSKNVKGCFGVFLSIGITYIIYICVFNKLRRKNWHENIEQYNDSLDGLKAILSEKCINYYSEKRIKVLIKQCKDSINEIKSDKENFKYQMNTFLEKYIVPIFAFSVGIMSKEIGSYDMLYICLLSVVVIVMIRISIKGISYIIEDAEGNKIEERKYVLNKLQDLLIRDFDIEDNGSCDNE